MAPIGGIQMYPFPNEITDSYSAFDNYSKTFYDSARLEAALRKKLVIRKKISSFPKQNVSVKIDGYRFTFLSASVFESRGCHFIEYVLHSETQKSGIIGIYFSSYAPVINAPDKVFYERVSFDRHNNCRLHVLYNPTEYSYDSLDIHPFRLETNAFIQIHYPYTLFPSFPDFKSETKTPVTTTVNPSSTPTVTYSYRPDLVGSQAAIEQILDNSEKIISIIEGYNDFPDIDITPPSDADYAVFMPLDCSYSKKCFAKLYLLREHEVHYEIISEYGMQQYQIPIKADNQALILLVCGEHWIIPSTNLYRSEVIGLSAIPGDENYIADRCEILSLIAETRQLIREHIGVSEASTKFSDALSMVLEWVRRNTDLAYKQYKKEAAYKSIWKSEFRLYQLVKLLLPDAVYQYRPIWLEGQSLDIYLPSLAVGIEYQGEQHYIASDYYGGDEGLVKNQERDWRKCKKCKEMGVELLEWRYDIIVTFSNVIDFINKHLPDVDTRDAVIAENIEQGLPFKIGDLLRLNQSQDSSQESAKVIALNLRQYDTDGEFVAAYESYKEASEKSGVSVANIRAVIDKEGLTAGGFQWRKAPLGDDTQTIEPIRRTQNSTPRAVLQVNSLGEIIAEYPSITSAANATGIAKKSIRDVAMNRQKTAGGYSWVFVKEAETANDNQLSDSEQ